MSLDCDLKNKTKRTRATSVVFPKMFFDSHFEDSQLGRRPDVVFAKELTETSLSSVTYVTFLFLTCRLDYYRCCWTNVHVSAAAFCRRLRMTVNIPDSRHTRVTLTVSFYFLQTKGFVWQLSNVSVLLTASKQTSPPASLYGNTPVDVSSLFF